MGQVAYSHITSLSGCQRGREHPANCAGLVGQACRPQAGPALGAAGVAPLQEGPTGPTRQVQRVLHGAQLQGGLEGVLPLDRHPRRPLLREGGDDSLREVR